MQFFSSACLQVVYGVKGYSVLHLLKHFDVIDGNPVDYMHCVLLGVMKKLLGLWLDSRYHCFDWLVLYKHIYTCVQFARL